MTQFKKFLNQIYFSLICGRLRYPIKYIAQNKIQILQIYIEGQYVIAITNMDGIYTYSFMVRRIYWLKELFQ